MAARSRASAGRPGGPRIQRIIAASGRSIGRACRSAEAGTTLRILGAGFGRNADNVEVLFDDIPVKPFGQPFSSGELLVTAPLPAGRTMWLRVRAGRRISRPVRFVLRRPRTRRVQPGEPTRELFSAIDQFAALTAALARTIGPGGPGGLVEPSDILQLNNAAGAIDGMRMLAQRTFETWMQWLPLQTGQRFQPLRTIEFYDQAVISAGLADRMKTAIGDTFGPGGPADAIVPGGSRALFSAAAGSGPAVPATKTAGTAGAAAEGPGTGVSIGTAGFVIHEVVKLIEGLENLFKILKPSAEAGAAVANVDVEVSLGEIFSAIAKLVDIIAQIMQKIGASNSSTSLNEKIDTILRGIAELELNAARQETKMDTLTTIVTEGLREINERTRLIKEETGDIEIRLDELGKLLGKTLVGEPWLLDPRVTRVGSNPTPAKGVKEELHDIEDKIDRMEGKADRQEEKLDRGEEKLDRLEEKLDREEEKLDHLAVATPPHEASVASQRDGGSNVTAAMVAIRRQNDRVHLRAAINVARGELDDPPSWTPWVSFGRPPNAGPLQSVSIDLQYEDNSNRAMHGLLSVRDTQGRIYHREFNGPNHRTLRTPARWSDWKDFLGQP